MCDLVELTLDNKVISFYCLIINNSHVYQPLNVMHNLQCMVWHTALKQVRMRMS